jgi:hypothetical protein
MNTDTLSRRAFLQRASLALPLSAAVPAALAAPPPVPGKLEKANARHSYFDKGTRLTISMWDFSWLHASHPGGVYEDLVRRLAEAAERGYNTLLNSQCLFSVCGGLSQ